MGNCRSYNSIYEQYQRTELLIGLKPNSKLPELNAILQCLCHIEPIINYFRYKYEQIKKIDSYQKHKKNGKCLAHALKHLIYKLYPDKDLREKNTYTKTESSEEFLEMIYKIDPKYNNNTTPLIEFIQKNLHNELNKVSNTILDYYHKIDKGDKANVFKNFSKSFIKENQSIISDYFFGVYYKYSTYYCGHKEYEFGFYSFDLFDLSQVKMFMVLNLPMTMQVSINSPLIISLNECLFYKRRPSINYENCKKHCQTFQCSHCIINYFPPRILCYVFTNAPNNTRFLIEEYFNINAYIEIPTKSNYELIGLIYICYPNLYIAYCKNPVNKMWYCYDNDKVKSVDIHDIKMTYNVPYMLFYQLEEPIKNKYN